MNSIEKVDIINIYKPIQKSLNIVDENLANLPVNQHPTLAKPLQHISNSNEYISSDSGLSYGFGLTLKSYDNIGITLRYSIFDSKIDMAKYQNGLYDFNSSSSVDIDLKQIRVGFDISYTFN